MMGVALSLKVDQTTRGLLWTGFLWDFYGDPPERPGLSPRSPRRFWGGGSLSGCLGHLWGAFGAGASGWASGVSPAVGPSWARSSALLLCRVAGVAPVRAWGILGWGGGHLGWRGLLGVFFKLATAEGQTVA